MRKNLILTSLLAVLSIITATAQYADYGKMSSMLRSLVLDNRTAMRRTPASGDRQVCAFVRIEAQNADSVLSEYGCRSLAHFGQIHIASIPLRSLAPLSLCQSVSRIEARRGNSVLMDTTALVLGATRVHLGDGLPQAFTGKGVVVGVEDIGFDLTHPNFYDTTVTDYRIKRFWDFLSTDTVGSTLFVGADYTTEEALKTYAHSRDAFIQSHGTHTLGSAAGSGYDSPYRGMAPESDICLVSNAVTDDLQFIDSADVYKFTYATDALGFKYIFDYADAVGKPCVVSFSEGSPMDFRGDDVLYYEVLDSITGPGHILVASAGNAGQQVTHVRKPTGMETARVAVISSGKTATFSVKGSSNDYQLAFKLYGEDGQMVDYPVTVADIYQRPDTLLTDTLQAGTKPYYITATCYPSCFNPAENVMEIVLKTDTLLGLQTYAGFDIIGQEAEIEVYRGSGYIVPADATLGDNAFSVHSPSSAPSVICVGATGYRTGITNYLGEYREYDQGTNGQRSAYSSVGPTYDGRIKPDVMAPGTNVISSYSSYYIEAAPEASDVRWDVEHFDFQGRTYAWNSNSGTSMSTPIVAGIIALWLQAKPDLSPEDVMGVISRTSRHDPAYTEYPNNEYGYGEIDAYAGLLDVLNFSGIEDLSTRQPSGVRFSFSGGQLHLDFDQDEKSSIVLKVYGVSGQQILKRSIPVNGRHATIDLSTLRPGVYAVQTVTSDPTTTGSTLIRK